MAYQLRVTPKAFYDIQVAIDYYQLQSHGLGIRFKKTIDNTLQKIANSPFSASISHEDIRYKVVSKFPYLIYYKIKVNDIFILRIFNTYQNPITL